MGGRFIVLCALRLRKPEAPVPKPDSLFAYGTLLWRDVWERVAKQPAEFHPAWCEGYAAYRVVGTDYPGLIPSYKDDRTFGGVTLGITPAVLARLDAYEGSQYCRGVVRVNCADGFERDCWTYLWNPEFMDRLSRTRWLPRGVGEESKRHWEAWLNH